MTSLAIIQTTLADYRRPLYGLLRESLKENLLLLSGACYFDKTVVSDPNLMSGALALKNYYFMNRAFLYQAIPFSGWYSPSCVVLELNPRILSIIPIIIVRRIAKRRTFLWGHAWPRSGRTSKTTWIRRILQRIVFGGSITYTYTDQRYISALFPQHTILAAPNAVSPSGEMLFDEVSQRDAFIYVGRLVKAKKPQLMIEGFAKFKSSHASDAKLIVIGEGPERQKLEILAEQLCIKSSVVFLGHVSDHSILKAAYSRAICSVSPGYVGLSVIQSVGFGVPMIVAKDEPHAPELEACIEGFTSFFFESDSETELAALFEASYDKRHQISVRGRERAEWCRQLYSVEAMADAFLRISRKA